MARGTPGGTGEWSGASTSAAAARRRSLPQSWGGGLRRWDGSGGSGSRSEVFNGGAVGWGLQTRPWIVRQNGMGPPKGTCIQRGLGVAGCPRLPDWARS